MKVITNPEQAKWSKICARPTLNVDFLRSSLSNLIDRVRKGGDKAVLDFTRQFDGVNLSALQVSQEEIEKARISNELQKAIQQAAANIRLFHQNQLAPEIEVETMKGVKCWRKPVPIQNVGIYIPGGTAPLFSSVLMMAIPASIAGCKEVILCSPPQKDGSLHPAILYAAQLTGIKKMYKVGGAQAIAAMAFGTESIPTVDKIFGPGNQYVTAAKQLVSESGIAIDMPAGPSEVAVLADLTANPAYIAADLLSQAEHGIDSQVLLVTTDPALPGRVNEELKIQLKSLPRADMAREALGHSKIVVMDEIGSAIDLINTYAPEHLIIQTKDLDKVAGKILNAGSVFLGNFTPESAGDYASGTNHTLPTNGFARSHSGLGTDSFVKYITFQQLSEEGLKNIGPTIEIMAEAEQLIGHKNAVSIRRAK